MPNSDFSFGCQPIARRVEQDLCSLQGGQAGRFRIPLIPADQHADAPVAGVEGAETEVTRGEIELLVEQWIVRDVHLAIQTALPAVRIEDDGGVVVQARRPAFEE